MIAAFVAMAMSATEPASGKWAVYGAGTTTCGSWTSDKETGSDLRQYKAQWLLGFLSGINMAMLRSVGSSVADAPDPAGYAAWIDNYCAANPLDTLFNAAESLGAELLRRKIDRR